MSVKKKKIKIKVKKQLPHRGRELIEFTGLLKDKAKHAKNRYENSRANLINTMKLEGLSNRWVHTSLYKAALLQPDTLTIDPIKFLRRVKSIDMRRALLRVAVGVAKEVLDHKTYGVLIKKGTGEYTLFMKSREDD